MSKHLIFIYGSLRQGCECPMSMRFPTSKFLANATARGSLFDLGEYPGLVSNDSNSTVVGELYEVDDELLKELDQFEVSSNYLRKGTVAYLGEEAKACWVYEPDPAHYSFGELIEDGDWVEYARNRAR